jgi:hypothetical protein
MRVTRLNNIILPVAKASNEDHPPEKQELYHNYILRKYKEERQQNGI